MTGLPTHLALRATVARLAPEEAYLTAFEDGEAASVGLYIPAGYDGQSPHDRDEIYVVVAGSGSFACGDAMIEFTAGDLLHVPAHVPHRFERFDPGFAAWVVFYGPRRAAV